MPSSRGSSANCTRQSIQHKHLLQFHTPYIPIRIQNGNRKIIQASAQESNSLSGHCRRKERNGFQSVLFATKAFSKMSADSEQKWQSMIGRLVNIIAQDTNNGVRSKLINIKDPLNMNSLLTEEEVAIQFVFPRPRWFR